MKMATVYDSLRGAGYNLKRYSGELGIEIETESKDMYRAPAMTFWQAKADGSLRDFGVEYVSKGPLTRGKELTLALEEWDTKINKAFKLIPDSYSTSVHIHLNFLNDKWIDYANFLTSYYSVENLLMKIAGPDRLSNLFCLPLCDAEGELGAIINQINDIGLFRYSKLALNAENYKYSALNLCNLTRLGTAEIRSLKGTINVKEIQNWIELLLCIKDFACQKGLTPPDIVEMVDKQGAEIRYPIFKDKVNQFDKIENKNNLVKSNLYFIAKIASASKFIDDTWGFPKPKKIYKEKLLEELDKLSMMQFAAPYKNLQAYHRLVVEEMLTRNMNIDVKDVIFGNGDE